MTTIPPIPKMYQTDSFCLKWLRSNNTGEDFAHLCMNLLTKFDDPTDIIQQTRTYVVTVWTDDSMTVMERQEWFKKVYMVGSDEFPNL